MDATTSPDPKSPDSTVGTKWDGKRRARNDTAPELFKPGPVEGQGNGIYEEEPTATRRIKSVSDLASIFGWSQREIRSLPSRAERDLDASLYSDSQKWKLMVQYTMSALFCSAEVIYPANCPALLEAVAEKLLKSNHTTHDELNRLVDALVTIANESPSQSIQMRVARAALIKGLSKFEIERLRAENKFKFSGSTRTRAYKDFSLMESGASLEKPVQRQKRFEEASAEKLVQFLLAPENLGTITRCSKRIAVGIDEFMEFPLLVRHKSPSELYDAYVAMIAEDDRISRSSFHETVSMVTVRDLTPSGQSQGPADDTTLGILVHDTIAMLQAIIKDCSETLHERATLESSLGLLTHFLTKEFDAHVRLGDDVPYHMSSFCLNKDFGATQFQGSCSQCHFIPYFFGRLRKLKVIQDSSRVITTCEQRIQLYQASRIRLANQKEAIQKVIDAMKNYSTSNQMDSTHALISISWKTPFITSRSASFSASKIKQSEPGGFERQVPWSCCVLSYYRYEKKESRAEQVNLYFDSLIASPHSRLGPELVAGVVEAILAQVHEKLPHMESVTLSLGTEECFASENAIVLFQLLNTKVWPKIEKVVYSEAPDRADLISRHYKRAQLHIDHFQRYSKPGVALRQICSAKGLARALAWGDGLQNAVVQLLHFDNSKLNEIMSMVDPLAKAMRNATRSAKCNIIGEVLLRQAEGMVAEKQLLSASDIDSCTGILKMTVFRYSGIGEGKQVNIDMLLTAAAATTKDLMNLAFDTDPQVATDPEIIDLDPEVDFHEVSASHENVGLCEPVPQDDFDFGHSCVQAPPLIFFGPSPYVAASMLSGVSVVLYSKFRELRAYRTRIETGAPKPTERKDLLIAVARRIKERVEKESTSMEIDVLFEKALAVPLSPEVLVPGWAVQQSVSPFDIVGFSADYKTEIENVFEQRPGLCASEVGPSQVRTALSRRFQDRYGIPGENEIKHEISKLVLQRGGLPDAMPSFTHHMPADHLNKAITQAAPSRNMLAPLEEQAHSSSSSNFRVKRGRKSPLTSVQNEYLMQLLDEHPDLKPQKALESFIAKFPEAKAHEKAVKSKISNAKAKRRRLVA